MFNQFNINNNIDIRAELLRNRRESLADITNYINKITYKLNSPSIIDIKINKYIMKNQVKTENNLYKIIRDKMQMILTINGNKERYILFDTTKTSKKNNGDRIFTAYSFEKTLENKLINFGSLGKSYPLINDGIVDGVLDIVSQKSGWNIGYVDELAKKELVMMPLTNTIIAKKYLMAINIKPEQLLWETDILVKPSIENVPVNISIIHKGICRYDSYGDKITKDESLTTILDPVYTSVTNIKAYYYSVAGNRYGIKFVLTLEDKTTVVQTKEFINLENLKMECDEVSIVYETGKIGEQETVKYVWLENIDTNVYNFLNDMQEEFNVLFSFDSYNNTINCYSKTNLSEESPLILSFDNNVIDLNIKQVESPISAVRVGGSEEISIVDINKYGADVIYNYNYFIDNDLISPELKNALDKYEKYLDVSQIMWDNLSEERRLLYENKVKLDCEIKSLSERILALAELLAAFISSGSSNEEQYRIKNEKIELEKLFNDNISLRNNVNERIDSLDVKMGKITSGIKREACGIFTDEDLLELNDIDIIESYTNDTATTSGGLYNSAEWYLNERTKPTVEFNIKCANLIKLINNPLGWNEILQLGRIIYLDSEISKEVKENQVRLCGMDIDVKNKTIENLSFTNKIFPIDLLKMAKKMQRKAMATIINNNTYKSVLENTKKTNEIMDNIKDNGININSIPIKTSELYSIPEAIEDTSDMVSEVAYINDGNLEDIVTFSLRTLEYYVENNTDDESKLDIACDNDIEQSSAGVFIKSKSNPNKQLYIGSGLFAISSDAFETSEIAIDNEGITAKLLKGQIILGEKLYITSEDGSETFYIGNMNEKDGFGLCVKDERTGQERIFLGTELDENGVKKAKLRLVGKNGEVAISEDGIVNTHSYIYKDDLDGVHPLTFPYPIDSGTFEIRECKLSIYLQKYRMTVKALGSGGTVGTTTEGGAILNTTGDGGFVSTTTADGGIYSNTISSAESVEFPYQVATSKQTDNGDGTHVHSYYYGVPKHSHSVPINIPNHSHNITINNHNHSINIKSHAHTLDTTHTHELQAGIFESTTPTNCSLYVNEVLVAENINSNISIDIKDFLVLGSDNNIKITSETLGRIQLSILNKSFVTN